jgi:hypothetical protein
MHDDERYPPWFECGTLYASSYDLERHVKHGCLMDENTDNDDTLSDVSEGNDDIWGSILQ